MRLEELTEEALRNNPELKIFESEVAAARGDRTQAGLWQNPEVAVEYGERRVKDPGGPLQGDGRTRGLAVMQPFEFPGKGSLRKAIADRNTEVATLGVDQFRLALKGKLRQLASRLVVDRQNLAIAREISDYAEAQVDLLRHRKASGIQGLLDLRVIEATLAEVRIATTALEQSAIDSLTELNLLLGRPASDSLDLDLTVAPPTRRFDVQQLVEAGLRHNFQLKSRERELERANLEHSAAELDTAPDFAIGPFYSQDKAADNEVNLGIALTMTVPLWDWNQGNIEASKARVSKAKSLKEQARRQVEAEIIRRHHAYRLAQKQLSHFQSDYLKKMHDAADLADRHYRLGAVSVQTFMEIQRQYLNAGKAYGEALLAAIGNELELEILSGGKPAESAR